MNDVFLANINPDILEGLKWIITFCAAIFFAIVGHWCKTMAAEIKNLQRDQAKMDVFMAEIKASISGREQLQDERWGGLTRGMEILHKDVQALVHSQLHPRNKSSQ